MEKRYMNDFIIMTDSCCDLLENYENPITHEKITLERLDVGGLGYARFVLKKGGSLGDLYSTAKLQQDNNGNIFVNANGEINDTFILSFRSS